MDDTHHEFVELLNALGAAQDADVLVRLDAFIAHTESHFAQEEAWMETRQFPPRGCHGREHAGILEVMREVRDRVANGELHYGRTLAEALAEWFPVHASSMDATLALFLENPQLVEQLGTGCADPAHVCENGEPASPPQ
jgi:hemerythrin-like metal-binding protein